MTDVPEMVEKVARALVAATGHDPDAVIHMISGSPPAWTLGVDQARAAISALREPTSDMVEAAWPNIMHENARDVWLDMIDAALGNTEVAR